MAESILCLAGGVTSIGMIIFAGIREAVARHRRYTEQTLSMEPYFEGEKSLTAPDSVEKREVTHV